jgi:type III pantothenate kinase
MLIAFDVSNTRIDVGLFDDDQLKHSFSLSTDVRRTPDEYGALLGAMFSARRVQPGCVSAAVVGSVVPPVTEALAQLCAHSLGVQPLCVGAGTRTGIRIATHNPRELGTDRVVNAVAAHRLYEGPAIVVDFSTATSFDIVGADGTYLGSVIAPGLALSAEALFQQTSRLPRVDLAMPRAVVGKDTTSALQSGLVYGHISMVRGMLDRIRGETGLTGIVIGTGEFATLVACHVPEIGHLEPHLTLIGLRLIYELNHDQ